MLLLFFFASALLCLVLCLHPFFSAAGSGMAGLSAGGLLFLLPVLLSYLYGQTDYLESCSRILTCLPAGVFMVLPICRLQRQGQLSPAEPAVLLSCFLLLAFFCIFFAWKQRFLILKNQQM